jgi:STE24 endopeptidase
MNIFLILVPAVLAFGYLLEVITETLNIKAISPELPEEFAGYYDNEKYSKSQNYLKDNTRFGLLVATVDLIVFLILIYGKIFNFADNFARSLGYGEILTGLIFVGVLAIAAKIIHLPFSVYDTFKLEQRYGFNKTTPKTFVLDLIKETVLSFIIGGFVLAGVIWFFENFVQYGWLYIWAAVTIFQLFISFIAPVVIMPLFNKFTPLEECELKTVIEDYATKQKFKLKGIYKIDGSRRSTKANAFFTGFGKFKRIALFDTLIEKLSVGQIVAVLAHEIGHFKQKHVIKGIVVSIIHTGVMLFIFSLFLKNENLTSAFGFENTSVYASLLAFGVLFSPINMAVSVWGKRLSRKHEYEADIFTVKTTGSADDLIEGLKKLTVDSLGNLTPHPLKVVLEYSHPPILERIKSLK